MKKENFKLLFIAVALLINACKKEKIQTDIFDLKNYVVHSVYQETNGRGLNYKAPQQLLMSFQNNQTKIEHVGSTETQPFPNNKILFTTYDKFFSNIDSLLVSIDTTNKTTEVVGKYGRTRNTIASNLIDSRQKNWDLNNLKLTGKVEMRNASGTLLQNPTSYILFNSDASKVNMQETAPSGNITFKNTIYFGNNTNYYREANREDATFQEKLFFVFLKQKVILSGYYYDFITGNTFYYYGELTKL
jgi:hypothetical protein